MLLIYIGLIALAAVPFILIVWRMKKSALIIKKGIHTNGIITHIKSVRTGKGGKIDILTIEYKDRATGQLYHARATVAHLKYKTGDIMTIAYLPEKPAKYAIDTKGAYWAILIFCIILFLFVIFAVYKIDEMMKSGQM